MTPVSSKNFRITVILIAVYKVLTALALLIVMLLGLAYSKKMNRMLYKSVSVLNLRSTHRQARCIYMVYTDQFGQKFESWAYTRDEPTIVTRYMLYFGTTVAIVYVLSCLALLIGVLRNRHKLFIPWFVVDILSSLGIVIVMVMVGRHDYTNEDVDKSEFLGIGSIIVFFHLCLWGVIQTYYGKLRKQPTVSNSSTDVGTCPSSDGDPKRSLLNLDDVSNVV